MPRSVSAAEIHRAITLTTTPLQDGSLMGQRDIEKATGLSRPYLRKIAKKIGHQFPRNGIEVIGRLCMCANCGSLFRRPPSKVERAKNNFCDELCKQAFMKGSHHPSWKHGKNASSFSTWIKNQAGYDEWRKAVLERDGYKCAISGREDHLQVHHIIPKAEDMSPEKALDVNNGMTLNDEVHREVHELIRSGTGFEEAIEKLRRSMEQNQYQTGISRPRYLRRWWMRTRDVVGQPATCEINGKVWILPQQEFYCPIWARPLDFLWKLIFGNPVLVKE